MKRTKAQWIMASLTAVLALGLIIVGAYGYFTRSSAIVQAGLEKMRLRAVLRTGAGKLIDDEALAAKKVARKYADANKYTYNQKTAYTSEQEALARQQAEEKYGGLAAADPAALNAQIIAAQGAIRQAAQVEAEEKKVFAAQYLQNLKDTQQAQEKAAQAGAEAGDAAPAEPAEPQVDYSGFVPSAQLEALNQAAKTQYDALFAEVRKSVPELTDKMQEQLRKPMTALLYQHGVGFDKEYDRYAHMDGLRALDGKERTAAAMARNGSSWLAIGFGLVVLALTIFYYAKLSQKLGMPRLVISLFFVLLCVLAVLYGISLPGMLGDILKRTGMFGVLALAMLPGIQSGISLNLGMTVGIISGLISTLLALEWNMTGWGAFFFSVIVGILLAIPVGWLYGRLLNRLKGSEMTVSYYVGASYVSLMCIAWMMLPFSNPKLTWALGSGLRVMHNMMGSFGAILDKWGSFQLFGAPVPTGLLIFFLLACLAVWLFSRSKTGTAMIAAGSNPRFAEASGLSVDRMRLVGTTVSTVIAAVGIIIYSQSFGFMQLYNGPKQMGLIAASAILIGGASVTRAKVSHVIIGTFLFQAVVALGIQVANAAIDVGGLAEVMRILISNGIILYALTQSGGEGRD